MHAFCKKICDYKGGLRVRDEERKATQERTEQVGALIGFSQSLRHTKKCNIKNCLFAFLKIVESKKTQRVF